MHQRERYLHHGPSLFGDTELLALALGAGTASRTALSIAADLLDHFGSVAALSRALPQELSRVAGVGPASSTRLHASLSLARRARVLTEHPSPVLTPEHAYRILGPGLQELRHEELHAVYLDRRRRPLGQRALTRGSDGFTVVDPRQIYRPAIALGASAVVLAHNHPSGDPTPSGQDVAVTERVVQAGRVLGVPLLDHLVVAGERFTSLAREGYVAVEATAPPAWTAECCPG